MEQDNSPAVLMLKEIFEGWRKDREFFMVFLSI